jgi:hypothetical protein
MAGDLGLLKPHSAQRGIYGVLAHAVERGTAAGEKIFAITSKRLESFQNINSLFGQWDKVRLLHLHLFRGDGPDCRVKVDLGPFGLPQFSRSNKDQGSKLQGTFDDERAFKGIDSAE